MLTTFDSRRTSDINLWKTENLVQLAHCYHYSLGIIDDGIQQIDLFMHVGCYFFSSPGISVLCSGHIIFFSFFVVGSVVLEL